MSLAWTAVAVAVVGAGMEVAGGIAAKKAAGNAAADQEAAAQWNADSDRARAQQDQVNTLQAITNERQQNKQVLSQFESYYTSAGVQDTGSALHVQATEAGKLEQQIQQQWVNETVTEANLYAQANVGLLEGQAQADATREQGDLALFNGIAHGVSTLGSALMGGARAMGGGATTLGTVDATDANQGFGIPQGMSQQDYITGALGG